jgi:uncharacterized protein YjbJ (UPF0337 family)
LGGTSEREFIEKMSKMKQKLLKAENDVKNDFAKMEKIKADCLKKTEEMRGQLEKDTGKIEEDITKSKDLAQESLQRLRTEIDSMRREAQQKYEDLKDRISSAISPR